MISHLCLFLEQTIPSFTSLDSILKPVPRKMSFCPGDLADNIPNLIIVMSEDRFRLMASKCMGQSAESALIIC